MFAVEGELTGMVRTQDGKLLILAGGNFDVFMDVEWTTAGTSDAIVELISEGDFRASVYVNVAADDFVRLRQRGGGCCRRRWM